MGMSRHSDWHHIQTERGGTEKERKENWENHKGNEGYRETKREIERERQKKTGRRAGAEETLEMTACKYANGGPLKWR